VAAGTAHVALYDTLADWEAGYLIAELRTGGGGRYVEAPAVVDGELITAGSSSPVQFACAALGRLGLASERFFHEGDPATFQVLMQVRAE
jgi:hypothetical protein